MKRMVRFLVHLMGKRTCEEVAAVLHDYLDGTLDPRMEAILVKHFEDRLEVMEGKAMVVCMSRRICVDLYNAIVELRPDCRDLTRPVWHDRRIPTTNRECRSC